MTVRRKGYNQKMKSSPDDRKKESQVYLLKKRQNKFKKEVQEMPQSQITLLLIPRGRRRRQEHPKLEHTAIRLAKRRVPSPSEGIAKLDKIEQTQEQKYSKNLNGSNLFGTIEIYSRHG